jgi:hypothetical protein
MHHLTNSRKLIFLFCFLGILTTQISYSQCGAGETYNTYCYTAFPLEQIAFEVCPPSGNIAQSTIIAGTVGSVASGNTLTVYEGSMGSGTTGTPIFEQGTDYTAGDDFSSSMPVITASSPDLCLTFVVNSVGASVTCSENFDTPLEVCTEFLSDGTLIFNALSDLCIYDGIQSGLSGGSPIGGVYSGPGVTDDGNGMTYTFDPTVSGVGVHTLTYTESGNPISDNVEVFGNGVNNCSIPDDGVGIGIDNDVDESAMLEVRSTVKGFLPPRLSTAQRDIIPNPAKGLIIYNLTLNCLQVNDGTPAAPNWTCISGM